jgi:hypothetical protein
VEVVLVVRDVLRCSRKEDTHIEADLTPRGLAPEPRRQLEFFLVALFILAPLGVCYAVAGCDRACSNCANNRMTTMVPTYAPKNAPASNDDSAITVMTGDSRLAR